MAFIDDLESLSSLVPKQQLQNFLRNRFTVSRYNDLYDVFIRKSYDSSLFYDLFRDQAEDIYSYLYNYDSSPYTLQQWALYRAKLKDFKQAFIYIERAMSEKPTNFSMQNSRAVILFEANRSLNTALALKQKKEAMDILSYCYNNDKRKIYHAQIFSEFAINLYDEYSDREYLEKAYMWINEIIDNQELYSRKTRKIRDELQRRI
ncbi:hypothetical protein FACS189496_0780 [Bacilli bacterium]|nr:hypothetical protein FACS189496_0780 [Bacilli bacterium]